MTNQLSDFLAASRVVWEVYFHVSDYPFLSELCDRFKPVTVLIAVMVAAESVRDEIVREGEAKSDSESALFREFRAKAAKICEVLGADGPRPERPTFGYKVFGL